MTELIADICVTVAQIIHFFVTCMICHIWLPTTSENEHAGMFV